jgi:aminocarboxymuconate-semialdehyde decarboxylase
MGAMIPYFEGRVGHGWDQLGTRTSDVDYKALLRAMKKRPIDYFRLFYGDTALFGSWAGMECGLAFFGPEHVLFGTDYPFDPEEGPGFVRDTIAAMEKMRASEEVKQQIYETNAQRMLRLKGPAAGK